MKLFLSIHRHEIQDLEFLLLLRRTVLYNQVMMT
nr:MAG TPA: hypothetical protein [Caudoviricetes sp.]